MSKSMATKARDDTLAEMVGIVRALESLEVLFIKDKIDEKAYTPTCGRLIVQFRTAANSLCIDVYEKKWIFQFFPHAMTRVQKGIAATVECRVQDNADGSSNKNVAIAVQAYITTMDALKLEMLEVETIWPLLNELIDALNKISGVAPDACGKKEISEWISKLSPMKAVDVINKEDARQMTFDLEKGYANFHALLK